MDYKDSPNSPAKVKAHRDYYIDQTLHLPLKLYFVSENHVLWAWSKTMALPVIFLSFERSDGVLDDWSIGGTSYRIFSTQGPRETVFVLPSGLTKPFSQSQIITPLLQQPRDLRARFWPPSRGLQTKPRPLGVDSLLMAKTTCGSKRLIVVSISSRDNFFTSSVYREKPNSSSALPTSSKKIPPEQMMTHEGCKRQ